MTKLSKPQARIVEALQAGQIVIVEILGHLFTFKVLPDGQTTSGRRSAPSVKALIIRGILVKGEGNRWTLAS